MAKKENLLLSLSAQDILFVIESLSLYKDVAMSDQFKPAIDELLITISEQLELQGIKLYASDKQKSTIIGKKCTIPDIANNQIEGIVLGSSDIDGLVKVVTCKNNRLEIIDIPLHIITNIGSE